MANPLWRSGRAPSGAPARVFVSASLLLAALLASGCGDPPREAERRDPTTGRWYTAGQVAEGGPVFARHCAVCHGERAEGAEEWFRRLHDGRWPPPPLNGTAHAWHHPLWQLRSQIRDGSDPAHGNMPAFGAVLTDAEIDAVIAWFQSQWIDEIYDAWLLYEANVPKP
jgi:mono/diheme cytochrome c family protein